MRHLIDRHGDCFLVGLRDRAYVVFGPRGSSDDATATSTVVELLPSPQENPKAGTKPASTPTEDAESKSKSEGENKPPAAGGKQPQPRKRDEGQQPNEICAVAILSEPTDGGDTVLRCAVARNDKSLGVYALNAAEASASKPGSLSPVLHYRTPKRVSCFAFARLPSAEKGSETAPLLVSGDVAGDSHAYNILPGKPRGRKLLLGHTASMLTDIALADSGAGDSSKSLLLTSDRDEKIRISRFPESWIIEGHLLGHTAYVTGVAVVARAQGSPPLVVSCGGDRTLRLWDLAKQSELCCLPTETTEIPTAIAVGCNGGGGGAAKVAVIFDGSKTLKLYGIATTAGGLLESLGSIDCPSRPLAIDFSNEKLAVVMKDPDYIALYEVPADGAKAVPAEGNGGRVVEALRELASTEKIAMPDTILEKDDYGNPVLQKENETRGPAAADQPWNRVERVGIAKERERRRKKAKIMAAAEK